MYEREIKRVSELVGIGKMNMGLAITTAATEAGLPVYKLAQEMRRHAHARTQAKKALTQYRGTVPEYAGRRN